MPLKPKSLVTREVLHLIGYAGLGMRHRGIAHVVAALLSAISICCGGGSPVTPSSASAGATPAAAAVVPTPDPGPPNVVLILADDLGWGDLGSYGNARIATPNLDRIAAEGMRFTSFYVPAPICAPSRAGLLTGRFPPRVGIPWNPPTRLHDGEVVIASVLKANGYATGMVGKWHVGWEREDMPIHYGFDFYYGIPAGEDEADFILGDMPTTDTVGPDELAKRYTSEAIKFITAQGSDRRFFMYIAHRDPHLDNSPSPEFAGRSGRWRLWRRDRAAGRHGRGPDEVAPGPWARPEHARDLHERQRSRDPTEGAGLGRALQRRQGSCEEGGVRVPAIMRWPARIPPGRVVNEPTSSLDLFPTIVALTGSTLPAKPYDGRDISKLLTGQVDRIGGQGIDGGREIVFFGATGPAGLRSGKWKYLRPGIWSGVTTLFDLEADPTEKMDLSRARPDLVKQLEARLVELLR